MRKLQRHYLIVLLLVLFSTSVAANDGAIVRKDARAVTEVPAVPAARLTAAQTLLFADFEDKTADALIGTGGAGVGEPVSVDPYVVATVRNSPMPSRSLEMDDNSGFFTGTARFEFEGDVEVTSGIVHIAADLWIPARDQLVFQVRERTTSDHEFVSLRFLSNGMVRVYDTNSSNVGLFGPYPTGATYPIEVVFDMDARTYDLILDGVTVIDDRVHGADPVRGIGAVLVGTGNDVNRSGTISVDNLHVWVETEGPGVLALAGHLDIKPGSCPNPLNVRNLDGEPRNGKSNRGGVLPIAILGSETFDVDDIDVSSLMLEGVAPLRDSQDDVGAPAGRPKDECECHAGEPDGYADLTLKFDKEDVAHVLGEVYDGDVVPLTLTGMLLDGTVFETSDCVLIIGEKQPDVASGRDANGAQLGDAYPNPFNPATTITFTLTREARVHLAIYDVHGRLVRTLVDGHRSADRHDTQWDGRSDSGATVGSGVYFYRMVAGNFAETRRLVLLK